MQLAGLFGWLAAGLPAVLSWQQIPVSLTNAHFVWWLVGYVGFAVAFALTTSDFPRLNPYLHSYRLALIAGMSLFTLLTAYTFPAEATQGILLVIVAALLNYFMPLRPALAWILVQTLLFGLLLLQTGSGLGAALINVFAFLAFQAFALMASHVALSEARSRAELARLNAELKATQSLLAESNRVAERVRISRELHDLIGHHLTALSLNLEVAGHLTGGGAQEHVQRAQSLAKLLLGDVREVVSTLRASGSLDLSEALHTLVAAVPSPRIHLNVPNDLGLDDPNRAQVVLRCVQEIITNAVKHAHAENLWLTLEREVDCVHIRVKDDGRGAAAFKFGHGLSGMRERLESLGGRLQVTSSPRGFSLEAYLPTGGR